MQNHAVKIMRLTGKMGVGVHIKQLCPNGVYSAINN